MEWDSLYKSLPLFLSLSLTQTLNPLPYHSIAIKFYTHIHTHARKLCRVNRNFVWLVDHVIYICLYFHQFWVEALFISSLLLCYVRIVREHFAINPFDFLSTTSMLMSDPLQESRLWCVHSWIPSKSNVIPKHREKTDTHALNLDGIQDTFWPFAPRIFISMPTASKKLSRAQMNALCLSLFVVDQTSRRCI